MLIESFVMSETGETAEVVARFDNPVAGEVRLVQYDLTVFNAQGACVGSSFGNSDECRLATGESLEAKIWGEIPAGFTVENESQLKAAVHASLYTRTLRRLGEVAVPGEQGGCVSLVADASPPLGDKVNIIVVRNDGEDGESSLEIRCAVKNNSQSRIDRVSLRSELLDDDGMSIFVEESETHVLANSPAVIQSSFWSSGRQLVGAKLSFVLVVYSEAHRYSAELTLAPEVLLLQ